MPLSYSEEFPLLSAHGLYASDILGDGNCLFNALSDQLFGNQNQHHILRARTIDYMRQNAEDYKPFMTCYVGGGVRRNPKRKNVGAYSSDFHASGPAPEQIDRVYEQHLQQMAKGGTWGDNMEIVAFSKAFDVNVKVYKRDTAFMIACAVEEGEKSTCHIAHHEWEHYSSIRNLDGPHNGLPHVTPKNLSPEELAHSQIKVKNTSNVEKYKLDIVAKSLPYAVDEQIIVRALEDSKGNVNNAVDRLLEAEEQQSISSQQSSGSFGRDSESSDDMGNGPNKKQDRRLSRASKTALKLKQAKRRQQIASKLDTIGDSLDSLINLPSGPPSLAQRKRSIITDSDDESSPFEPLRDGDTSSGSEYSGATSAPPPAPSITGIKLRLTPSSAKPSPAPTVPPKRLVSARDIKTSKKIAQKAAAKERKQTATSSPKKSLKITNTSNNTNPSHPTVANGIVGLKTLYI